MTLSATRPHDVAWPDLARFGHATPRLVRDIVITDGASVAVIDGATTLSWSDLERASERAAQLLTSHGIGRGDVVAMQLPNWWEAIALALGAWRLGAVLNPVTPIYRAGELRTIFAMAQPSLVIYPGSFGSIDYAAMTRQALSEAGLQVPTVAVRGGATGLATSGPAGGALPEELTVDDVSVLMFTSGTTGRPKGVLHSQRTLLYEAASIGDRFALQRPNIFMPSPLTHITGLLYGVLLPILTVGRVVLQDRWDAAGAVDLIEAHGCDFCVGATPFLAGLVQEYRVRSQRLAGRPFEPSETSGRSALRAFVCGGADVPPAVIEEAGSVMGTVAVRAYGLTELPTLTCGRPEDALVLRSGDDGALVGMSEARLVDVEDGRGDLEARGPELFLGYLDPDDNAAAFTDDGWFRTGDLAEVDGDRVRIVGRRKDIIVRGGENLSPIEVENLVRAMPGIADIAIVGVPDEVLGERACAMVVVDGEPPTLAMIRSHLAAQDLAPQKAPEYLLTCASLPRTASGKVQKYVLRQEAAARLAAGEGERR